MAVTHISIMPQTSADRTANASTNTPDVPFNRVLSNEMSQHQQLKSAGKDTSQDAASDDKQVSIKTDSKDHAEDVVPQVSAEMLAMLGNLQPASTAPQQGTAPKAGGEAISAVNTTPQPVTVLLAKFSPMQPTQEASSADPSKPILDAHASHANKQSVSETPNQPIVDAKTGPIAEPRPDAKFATILTNSETTKTDIRSGHIGEDANTLQMPIQAQTTNAALQPAVVGMVQNLAGLVTDKLTPRVGTPGWDQALGQKIVWMLGGAEQTASISLNPPDLGPLQVVLNVTNDQANATFIAAQPEVRLAIEAAMPKLREMMSDAGIQLGQANVSADNGQQQNAQADARSSQRSSTNQEFSTEIVNLPRNTVSSQGLVNTFV